MKHSLFILIFFLLLFSPVIGQETGVLYQYETSSGFVWKSVGSKKLQPKYEGEIKNGNPNGFGFITYPYDDKSILGEWKNSKERNTKHTKKDGTLIGKFEDGKWILMLGVLHIGERNGKLGYFTERWEGLENEHNRNIAKYEGEIENGELNGQGILSLNNGKKYGGEWKNGKYNGQGTLTLPDGEKYVGGYKDGERNGQGTFNFLNGEKYVGEWKNGEKNGQGTYIWSIGDKYIGEYKDDKRWNGIYYDKNENIIGKFVNGKRIKK